MYAIIRAEKMKNILNSKNHNMRIGHQKPNINLDRTNKNPVLVGDINFDQVIKNRVKEISEKQNQTIRKDANLAVEFILSASPEFFYNIPNRDEWEKLTMEVHKDKITSIQSTLNEEKTQKWIELSRDYLKKEFGENLISAVVHFDEKTPHIHAVVLPVVNGRLTCKKFFTPTACRKWQDSYAKQLSSLGLMRGKENSEAIHTSQKEFYKAHGVQVPKPPMKPDNFNLMNGKEKYEELYKHYKFYKEFYKQHKDNINAVEFYKKK